MIVAHASHPISFRRMAFKPTGDFTLGPRRPDLVERQSGRTLEEATRRTTRFGPDGWLSATFERRMRRCVAEMAMATGRLQIADGLDRAAELARVPDDQLLEIHAAVRLRRSTSFEPRRNEAWSVVESSRFRFVGGQRTPTRAARDAATRARDRGRCRNEYRPSRGYGIRSDRQLSRCARARPRNRPDARRCTGRHRWAPPDQVIAQANLFWNSRRRRGVRPGRS